MQVSYQYQGKWHIKSVYEPQAIIGRKNKALPPTIDLSPDETVSRKHARIWVENGVCWIEDLGSRYGTKVNGTTIAARQQLMEGDTVLVGETTLRVDAGGA